MRIFWRNREVTLHARIFKRFLRWCIILNNVPKPHHFIYFEVSHRFHLYKNQIKQNGTKIKVTLNELNRSNLFQFNMRILIAFFSFFFLLNDTTFSIVYRLNWCFHWPVDTISVSPVDRAPDGIYYNRKMQLRTTCGKHLIILPSSKRLGRQFYFAYLYFLKCLLFDSLHTKICNNAICTKVKFLVKMEEQYVVKPAQN